MNVLILIIGILMTSIVSCGGLAVLAYIEGNYITMAVFGMPACVSFWLLVDLMDRISKHASGKDA